MSDAVFVPAATKPRRSILPRRRYFVHNSGRFDRSALLWREAIKRLRSKGILITGTEAAGRSDFQFDRALTGSDWDYAHLSGAAVGECYGTWDGSELETFAKPFAHKLTNLTWVRSAEYGGKEAAPVHALVLPLRHLRSGDRYWIPVVHMPLDNTPARAAAWVDCCQGLAELQDKLAERDAGAEIVIVGDWNKNLRLRQEAGMVRQNLEKPLRLVTSWTLGLPKTGGTHGAQVIDYALLRRPILAACQLLADGPDSDHRAFRYRIRSTKEKP